MIDFSGYTTMAILQELLDLVDDSLDKREGSLIWTALGPVAWWLEGNYMTLDKIQQNGSPFTAAGDSLDNIVALRGITRKPATAAVRQGSFDAPVPTGSLFRTVNGADSVIFESGDLISDTGGVYIYKMTCQTAGAIGDSYTGPILPVTAIAGLTQAAIGTIITGGTDEETDASLRARFFESFGAQPYGGNIAEYRQAILATPGVGAVQVYPTWQGGGTALCSILGSDLKPAVPALIAAVQEEICPGEDGSPVPSPNGYGIAPIGAAVTISTGTELTLDISMDVEFVSTVVDGADMYRPEIEAAVEAYIQSVRETWGNALTSNVVSYPVTIYAARLIYAILSIPEIVNVTNLTINGQSGDIALTETSALQQVPVVGTITINEV